MSAMGDDGIAVKELKVDGGMTKNDTLMQLQADLLDCPIARASIVVRNNYLEGGRLRK